jgi:hypothetical protein
MKKTIYVIFLLTIIRNLAFADTVSINHFVVKDNPFADSEIAVTATDSLGNIKENVDGVFAFTINGFQEQLKFDKGTAFYRHKLDKSSFFYVKHINNSGTHSLLYYIYKQDNRLHPIHISWILLLAIPIILILLGYMFKRFIIIAVIIFLVFLYFNHHNGLSMPTFFESIIDGLKGMF